MSDIESIVASSFRESIDLKSKMLESELVGQIESLACRIIDCLLSGNKVIFAGNGGSFADAQHLAAEFISRFLVDRSALPGMALGTNNSNMSAIGNDYGYENVFARELDALGATGDIFIPITTSGNSQNLVEAAKVGKARGLGVIALTGKTGGVLSDICECIKVPSTSVPRIQECHILIGHVLCEMAEKAVFNSTN